MLQNRQPRQILSRGPRLCSEGAPGAPAAACSARSTVSSHGTCGSKTPAHARRLVAAAGTLPARSPRRARPNALLLGPSAATTQTIGAHLSTLLALCERCEHAQVGHKHRRRLADDRAACHILHELAQDAVPARRPDTALRCTRTQSTPAQRTRGGSAHRSRSSSHRSENTAYTAARASSRESSASRVAPPATSAPAVSGRSRLSALLSATSTPTSSLEIPTVFAMCCQPPTLIERSSMSRPAASQKHTGRAGRPGRA